MILVYMVHLLIIACLILLESWRDVKKLTGGATKVHEELHVQRKWMKEWRQVGRHLQAMEGGRGDRIS